MSDLIVLTRQYAEPILTAREEGASLARTSLDLGLSESEALVDRDGATFPDGRRLAWEEFADIADHGNVCFSVEDGKAKRIQFFSEEFNRTYSLMPTRRAPTMLLSGIPMHRFKEVDPHEDTLRKIKTIAPIVGATLDTTTGLGYTAIEAAKTASEVVTIELDPVVLEVARRNPWSQTLFDNPKITQKIGDACEIVPTFADELFARIFHDPPTFSLAGELYSGEFYRQLHRVLKRGGRLFHYIGDLDSTSGRVVAKGAVRRLQEAGFSKIVRRPEAFGLAAYK